MAYIDLYERVSDVVASRRDLSTFNQLLRRSGVIAEMDGDGPFTLLAPDNAAFLKLPEHELGDVVRTRLADSMRYHVIPGHYTIEGLAGLRELETLGGYRLPVLRIGDDIVFGSAHVEEADISAGNGVVHVIDTVLFP